MLLNLIMLIIRVMILIFVIFALSSARPLEIPVDMPRRLVASDAHGLQPVLHVVPLLPRLM